MRWPVVVGAVALAGCPSQNAAPTQGTVATEAASAGPPAASTTAAAKNATCAPWAPTARSVVAHTTSGRGDFFREFRYDFTSGELTVHDSDPFAHGPETKDPRVIQKTKALSGEERANIESALLTICPNKEAMKQACAPGGCSSLTVTHATGPQTRIEHNGSVVTALALFVPSFPELRTK